MMFFPELLQRENAQNTTGKSKKVGIPVEQQTIQNTSQPPFKKECKDNGFSKCGRFVVDTNNYKQPGTIYFLSEKTKIACPTDGCKNGGEQVAKYKKYLKKLGSKANAFYVDEAFN